MAKAAKKLPQPKPSNNGGFIDAIDELHVAKNMFECAYLAVSGAGIGRETVNAIQSVMARAHETLEAGIAKVEAAREQTRKNEVQS